MINVLLSRARNLLVLVGYGAELAIPKRSCPPSEWVNVIETVRRASGSRPAPGGR